QDLALALEPRGTLLLRLSLQVFGAELTDLVQRESSEKPVPLIIQKTVTEINRRGLKVQGVYRLCGSSSLKKQLRDSFESDSSSVELQECPDLHAVTGKILKDYLRELPSPLITPSLYEAVKEVMTSDPCVTADPVQLLQCLPPVHRATLSYLMDHLSLVSSFSSLNKMSAQNLAVCFGAVFFAAVQTDQWECGAAERSLSAQGVDFKQHIEALHFLLSHWPGTEEEAVLDFEAPFNCRLSLKDFDLLIQDFHRQLNQV
uniref:Rho-GAP domain-containing protein n=1 Tax=Periophthalmus magnuspinnatus TaxID=409849 RepID=A0A3B4BDC2_9GOBI